MHSLYLFFLFLRKKMKQWEDERWVGRELKKKKKQQTNKKKKKRLSRALAETRNGKTAMECYLLAILCLSYFSTGLSVLCRQGEYVAQQ